ncbi:hypothetical protein BJY01DRAFT_247886 [Aspergillus pseudoustus]|uniref:DUF7580 domain-containing protein n=1 Tax=Aspergillus pseudoustus TaxID=1810923 RepID=A0ABR4JZT5_9EURO
MSGLEIAGVVLGAIPLILSLLEKYSSINKLLSFQSTRAELQEVVAVLERVSTRFQRVVETLLQRILDPQQASEMLLGLDHESWSNPTVQAGILTLLGPSTDYFNALCFVFNEKIQGVKCELVEKTGGHSGWGKRLRFTLGIRHLRQELRDSEQILDELQLIVDAAIPQFKADLATPTRASNILEKAEHLSQRAKLLRLVLKHMPIHKEIAIYPMAGIIGHSGVTFTLLFRTAALSPESESTWQEARASISPLAKSRLQAGATAGSPNSQSHGLQFGRKSVRFKDYPLNPIDIDEMPRTLWVESLAELGRRLQSARPRHYGKTSSCFVHQSSASLITVKLRTCENLMIVSLKDVLHVQGGIPTITNKLALAVALARAFLLFYDTGFMPEILTQENIWFARESNEILLGNILFPAHASEIQRVAHQARDQLHFCRICTMLGALLVEVLLTRGLPVEDQAAKRDSAPLKRLSGALWALPDIQFRFGHSICKAVQECLQGIEPRDNVKTQKKAFLDLVLRPLEKALLEISAFRVQSPPSGKTVLVNDWVNAVGPYKNPDFPLKLDEDTTELSPLKNPAVFEVFIGYVESMRISCANIPWLSETFSEEARLFGKILEQLEELPQPAALDSLNVGRIELLVRQCVRGISTIPQIYEDEAQSASSRKAAKSLQSQLNIAILELSGFLPDLQEGFLLSRQGTPLMEPKSRSAPTPSRTSSVSDLGSIFDRDSFPLSAQTSVAGDQATEIQYLDSRGLAREILVGLQDVLDPRYLMRRSQPVNEQDFSSSLRQILVSYFESLQKTDRDDTFSAESSPNPIYQKAHAMAYREIEFLLSQLASMCRAQSDIPHSETLTKANNEEMEIVPALLATDFLVGGKAFGRLRFRLRRAVQQDTMDIIQEEVLQCLPLATLGLYSAVLNVRWDVSGFIMSESDDSTDIGKFLTLTGGSSQAYARRCADYLQWLWQDSKYEICDHIQEYLKHNIYEHPDSTLLILPDGQNGIRATVIGAKETIIAVAQQLAWLTVALRSSSSGAALSDVDFIATKGFEFFIEPGALTNLSSGPAEEQSCWHRLVRNAAIANGFPIPPRGPGQVGLELPFTVMLTLSGARSFVMANKRLALYGFSSFLFPTDHYTDGKDDDKKSGHSIQWHFEAANEPGQYFDCADFLADSNCTWKKNIDERAIATSRHFVGFCRVAEFRLGTSKSEFTNLQQSLLPEASTAVGARIEKVTMGTGGLGFFTAEFEGGIRYPKNIFSLVSPDEYHGTLDTVNRMSMILWDSSTQCGWLVPAQALLLHMAHKWVQSNGIAATFRYADQGTNSYLEDVDDILRTDRKKVIRAQGRDDDTDFELRHLTMRIWNDIRGCMIAQQSAIRDGDGVIGYQSKAISGWELMDFITRPPLEFSMKQDKNGPSDDSWRALALEKNIPVLFCEGAGDVITATASASLCANCNPPLKQESFLVASLASLNHMAQRYGGFQAQTRLTTDWGWQPTAEAALFREHCLSTPGKICHERLQRLINLKDWQHGGNLTLPVTGAVVFGRPGSRLSGLALATATQSPDNAAVPGSTVAKQGKLKKLAERWRKLSPKS